MAYPLADYNQNPFLEKQGEFSEIKSKFMSLMFEIESEVVSSPDPNVLVKIAEEIGQASREYIKNSRLKRDRLYECEDLAETIGDSIGDSFCVGLLNNGPKAISSKVNELEKEPITIKDIPSIYKERPFTAEHLQRVLDVLKEKYHIQLSVEGKETSDVLHLSLEEIGIGAMDVKLFIPSMFMNKVNEYREPDQATFLYQEDYNFIEQISVDGTLENLVQLYATLDGRRKQKDYTKVKCVDDNLDDQ